MQSSLLLRLACFRECARGHLQHLVLWFIFRGFEVLILPSHPLESKSGLSVYPEPSEGSIGICRASHSSGFVADACRSRGSGPVAP